MKKIVYVLVAVCLMSVFCLCGCGKSQPLKVYVPDGAPSLSLVSLMAENYEIGGKQTHYEIVSSEKIAGLVANKSASLAVLPTNLATKVCGEEYKILSVMTFGNLYILGKGDDISQMLGNSLYVLNLNNVPGLTLRLALQSLNIDFSLTTQTQNNVKLVGSSANEIIAGFMTEQIKFAVVAEPALSKICANVSGLNILCDIQKVYGNYPQSVLVVKKNLLNDKKIKQLVAKLSQNKEFLQNNLDIVYDTLQNHLEKGLTSSFSKSILTLDLIERCNVGFKLAQVEMQSLTDYVLNLHSVQSQSANPLKGDEIYEII